MTTADAARTSLADAQRLLEQIEADHQRFDEFLTFVRDSGNRAAELAEYYAGQGIQDTEAVLADDPEAMTPAVANEDSAWEALAGRDDRMLQLLRLVTAELTSGLDQSDSDDAADADDSDADDSDADADDEGDSGHA